MTRPFMESGILECIATRRHRGVEVFIKRRGTYKVVVRIGRMNRAVVKLTLLHRIRTTYVETHNKKITEDMTGLRTVLRI